MNCFNPNTTSLATALAFLPEPLAQLLSPHLQELARHVEDFCQHPPTPQAAQQFESELDQRLRALGRDLVEWTFNHLETDDLQDLPPQIIWENQAYRRRAKSPRRCLDSFFGPIVLQRFRYESVEPGEPSLFPLELALGIEADRATAALADRVGQAAATHTQTGVRELLVRHHGVHWSVKTLRKVTAHLSAGLAEHREAAQAAKLVEALRQAKASAGPHEPTVSVGRDGVMVPLRGKKEYSEASAATVSVLDRQGRRTYTAYLGRMPEEGQKTLSTQLTGLLVVVVASCRCWMPRWQYVTDGGSHPTAYFRDVLRKMRDPRTGARLAWEWVIDFYHACGYLTKLGTALYGATRRGESWTAKMRRWLLRKAGGVQRVLYSAAAVRARRQLSAADEAEYHKAWNYLQKRKRRMDYAGCKGRGLLIGSGVTEAACKTVFTQRLKLSGMRWGVEGGQVIVDLRVLVLSQVWTEAHRAYLASKPQVQIGGLWKCGTNATRKAA